MSSSGQSSSGELRAAIQIVKGPGMVRSWLSLGAGVAFIVWWTVVSAFAQSGHPTALLSGVVVDRQGAVVRGATVVVLSLATGVSLPATLTNETGLFTQPALDPGGYVITVSIAGFKTARLDGVR